MGSVGRDHVWRFLRSFGSISLSFLLAALLVSAERGLKNNLQGLAMSLSLFILVLYQRLSTFYGNLMNLDTNIDGRNVLSLKKSRMNTGTLLGWAVALHARSESLTGPNRDLNL